MKVIVIKRILLCNKMNKEYNKKIIMNNLEFCKKKHEGFIPMNVRGRPLKLMKDCIKNFCCGP
jgi:hypothetical protein